MIDWAQTELALYAVMVVGGVLVVGLVLAAILDCTDVITAKMWSAPEPPTPFRKRKGHE